MFYVIKRFPYFEFENLRMQAKTFFLLCFVALIYFPNLALNCAMNWYLIPLQTTVSSFSVKLSDPLLKTMLRPLNNKMELENAIQTCFNSNLIRLQ